MTIFDDVYAEVLSRVRASSLFGSGANQIRIKNVVEYTGTDQTKRLYSTSDYPRLEIVPQVLTPAGFTSNSRNFLLTLRITLAGGKMDFESRIFPIQLGLLDLAYDLCKWRKEYENGDSVLGSAYSAITYGKYAPERGEETVDGWAFQFTMDFRIHLKN